MTGNGIVCDGNFFAAESIALVTFECADEVVNPDGRF